MEISNINESEKGAKSMETKPIFNKEGNESENKQVEVVGSKDFVLDGTEPIATMETATMETVAEVQNKTEESGMTIVLADEVNNISKDKNQSKEKSDSISDETYNNELQIKCYDCEVLKCVMWRKLNTGHVLCNICHLKRAKSSNQPNTNISSQKNISNFTQNNNKSKELPIQRISKRKSKLNKKFTNGAYDRIIKNGHSKNRRNLYKRKPNKAVEGINSVMVSQSVYHNGLLYEVGDIICTADVEGGTYFAQARGFFQDEFCDKSVVITWLIPLVANPSQFDPMLFVPGTDEDQPRPMECFDFVCRAPSNLFKSRYTHPPFQRVQSDLDNLIFAAKCIQEGETIKENIAASSEHPEPLTKEVLDISNKNVEKNVEKT